MDVFWLEQSEADVPDDDDWLSPVEKTRLKALRVPKRRADWRLGRWTAKRALASYLDAPSISQALAKVEVRTAASGAPEIFVANRSSIAAISLSHRDSIAMCAIAPSEAALGCDLELIEPRSDAFVADYFTGPEQKLVADAPATDRPLLSNLIWSAKESALKAIREGLRLDARSAAVNLPEGMTLEAGKEAWQPLSVHCGDRGVLHGWWRQTGNFVQTVVANPAPGIPLALRVASVVYG